MCGEVGRFARMAALARALLMCGDVADFAERTTQRHRFEETPVMNRVRTLTAAVMFVGLVAITLSSTTVNAFDGSFTPSPSLICRALAAAESAASTLPDSYNLKQAILNYIHQAQTKYNCPAD
jgi:hypothetical protein